MLAKLQDLAGQKAAVLGEEQLDEDTKAERVNGLQVKIFCDATDGLNMFPCGQLDGADIEDLAMTMEYSPSSKVTPGRPSTAVTPSPRCTATRPWS